MATARADDDSIPLNASTRYAAIDGLRGANGHLGRSFHATPIVNPKDWARL